MKFLLIRVFEDRVCEKLFKKMMIIIAIVLFFIILIFYKRLLISLTVRTYMENNNIKDYHISNIEKYPVQDGYIVQLKNNSEEYRSLIIISEIMPVGVIGDSKIDKEDMK